MKWSLSLLHVPALPFWVPGVIQAIRQCLLHREQLLKYAMRFYINVLICEMFMKSSMIFIQNIIHPQLEAIHLWLIKPSLFIQHLSHACTHIHSRLINKSVWEMTTSIALEQWWLPFSSASLYRGPTASYETVRGNSTKVCLPASSAFLEVQAQITIVIATLLFDLYCLL